MAVGRQIYELHQLDASILATDSALALVNRKLTDDSELRKAEAVLSRAQEKLAGVERRQREAEALMSDIQARLGPLETKTYDGSVGNPRELQGMQREVETSRSAFPMLRTAFSLFLTSTMLHQRLLLKKKPSVPPPRKIGRPS